MAHQKAEVSADPARALFGAALELLTRREYSRLELRQKLAAKFPSADFDTLFARLQELNYQSDQRFAEMFARSRVQRGQGPIRIRQELQQRGVSRELIAGALDQLKADWFTLAAERLHRKYRAPIGDKLPRDQRMKERARRQRYLAYRGFPADAIGWALDGD
ncbi:recombination regulator RecX [Microbulbifer sp. OS29]|uniref:Regulatory protein RecX n=1 Tax=Microbulbifer okhotskensis TaxID=2926617 RepID=A0A9X2J6A5_9GAMM|nr:regulatory protein RecX [Microbulbifer okhotskensis]MCO1336058.1 recombination regulator RecX [Microbulbifer okhotskensis]